MNIHVYVPGTVEPVKFYDTDAKSRFQMIVTDAGCLAISQWHVDEPTECIAAFEREDWQAAFDVNYDPNIT